MIKRQLATFSRRTITLAELEEMLQPLSPTYEAFSAMILQLETEQILEMVKSKGRTARTPSLAFQYRIHKSILTADYHQELIRFRNMFHPAICIDDYFSQDPSLWHKDLPYIQKIDKYIKHNSFPLTPVPAPERSFELVGNEKWIEEKGGKEILERINIWSQLQIIPIADPLMFAINPNQLQNQQQLHLIVENKTTYDGLLPALVDTEFSTLIYGRGKSVIKSIEQFSRQFPIPAIHHFFYFGDLDREGLMIWHRLNQRQPAQLALPFYEACLLKQAAVGKAYQRKYAEAEEAFLHALPHHLQEKLKSRLAEGYYYPQEILKSHELQEIWRDSQWKTLISEN